jgi:hypothetical protein
MSIFTVDFERNNYFPSLESFEKYPRFVIPAEAEIQERKLDIMADS